MKKHILLHSVGAAALLALATSSAQALPFQNGSFELFTPGSSSDPFTTKTGGDTTITGWTVIGLAPGGGVDHIGDYWMADDGHWSIDLDGTVLPPLTGQAQGGIAQTFDTVIGQNYHVVFAVSGNPDGGPNQKFGVSVATTASSPVGGTIFSFDIASEGNTHANMKWTDFDFDFTAGGLSTTLTFLSGTPGNFGPAIDNVRVSVPEPATLALLGAGLLGLGLIRRRKA